MTVSRTLSFLVGLPLGMALGLALLAAIEQPATAHGDTTIVSGCGDLEQLFLLRAIADRLGVHR